MHRQHVGAHRHDRDRAQILGGVALVARGGVVDGERRGGREDRIAVGRSARHRAGRQIAAGAAAVLHHYGLPEPLGEFLPDQPRHHVGNSTCREGDQEGDVLRGIGLRPSALRTGGHDEGRGHKGAS